MTRRVLGLALSVAVTATTASWPVRSIAQAPGPPFVIVSGSGYEGAIIPAESVVHRFGKGEGAAWTPTVADVAAFEEHLLAFVASWEREGKNPNGRPGQLGPPRLTRDLPALKRQYFGYRQPDGTRRIVVHVFNAPPRPDWKSDVVVILDGGCHNSWFNFDLDARRFVSAECGATG